MKIFLANDYKIEKFILNDDKEEFFTYSYKLPNQQEEYLFSFEKKQDKWFLKGNGIVNAISSLSKEVIPYKSFDVKILGYNGLITLWALPDDEVNLYNLSIENVPEITIGSGKSTICYRYSEIAPLEASIKLVDNKHIFQVINDKKYRIYLNNNRVSSTKELKSGDVIFIDGLIIIWMNSFITINNPGNAIGVTGLQPYNLPASIDNTNVSPVSDEDQNYKLYDEDDYFFHIPRIREIFEDEEIEIESPPPPRNKEEMPWYLKIGTSLIMMVSSMVMAINIFNNINAKASIMRILPQIMMLVAMIVGVIVFPRLMERWKKKQDAKYEKKRTEKFGEYLANKEKAIDLKTKQAIQILNDNNLSSTICKSIAVTPNNRNFWSREIISNDFLTVRLGTGTLPSPIKINAPEQKFELETDFLLKNVYEVKDKYKNITNVPISISLLEKYISAFICTGIDKYDYFKNILIQLIALHSGADLKIAIFTNEDNAEKWDFAKFLPHCWSEDKSFRYFATNNEEIKNVSAKLEDEFKQRYSVIAGGEKLRDENDEDVNLADKDKKAYINFSCYYLVICDNYKNNFRIPIIDDILTKNTNNLGFSLTILSNSLKNLPTQCDTFIEIGNEDGCVLSRDISSKNQLRFKVEKDNSINLRDICKTQINIPLVPKEGLKTLPTTLSFLEMYGVSKIEQLNILNRWKTNNPVVSLSTPIGVYANGETFKLDLHEKYHGPHGLIAGTTGSGKSEFIISYILSMCVNYHPYEVQFVLIDYKGGGLAGAFENRELGTRIPHLAGTITNLDTASMNRTLVSIQSELKRRQQIFNQTRDSLGESTVDIYKYQKFYREGIVKEPLPHLFIISDEFAELKSQQPGFMDELISTARIGRSLGVHLILATQKPSGVVNDQIWSNSKFKICLKVQDKSDSMEVLKRPDAAYIKEAGRFYLQVGNDDFFDKGQSGWSGAKYIPSDKIIKKVDDSINFVNNTGDIIKSIKDIVKVETKEDCGEQLTNIVKYISEIGSKEKIITKKLWLDPIPDTIYISNLKKKYSYKAEPYVINPIIGEYDSPSTQTQGVLTCNFNEIGNVQIVGKQGSGKENLIITMLLSSIIDHTPDELNIYIIDCGSEVLRPFSKIPHVGEIAFQDDKDLIYEILKMIDKEIEIRKNLMSDYGGNYLEYIKDSGNKLPRILVVINNYDVFMEGYNRLDDQLLSLYRDCHRYGIDFIVSTIANTALRNRVAQYFPNKYLLQLNNTDGYRGDFGVQRGLIPSSFFGRGLALLNGKYYEFQTAYLVKKSDINKFIREAAVTYNKAYTSRAKKVPIVPDIVYDDLFYDDITSLKSVPIGYNIKSKEKSFFNFEVNQFNQLLTTSMSDDKMSFIYSLSKIISKISNVKLTVIDFVKAIEKEIENVKVYNENFDNAIIEINNEIIKNKQKDTTNVYLVLGAGMINNKLSNQGKIVLEKLFEKISQFENTKFILMDVLASYRNLLVEEWYQKYINNTAGIWLDADISNQMIINAPNVSLEDRKIDFPQIGYKVENGKHEIIKFMIERDESLEEGETNG